MPESVPSNFVPHSNVQHLATGQQVWRRGRPARIAHIDRSVEPPSLVVTMDDSGSDVGVEVDGISLQPTDREDPVASLAPPAAAQQQRQLLPGPSGL